MKRRFEVTERDLCFLVHTYRDTDDLFLCVRRLRTVYPEAPLIVVADGESCDGFRDLTATDFYRRHLGFNAKQAQQTANATLLVSGERLFLAERGGEIVHRMLGLYLTRSPAEYLIKIDTDTHVRQRLPWVPEGQCCFGTLQSAPRAGHSVQGGAMGFTRSLAEPLHATDVFLDPALQVTRLDVAPVHSRTWVRTKTMQRRVEEQGLASIDWIVAHVARKRFPIEFVAHDAIRCLHERRPRNEHLYAITHPSAEKAELMNYPWE